MGEARIMYAMSASNNKPSRRSARSEQRRFRTERSSRVRPAQGPGGRRGSASQADAYRADKYGSSTHRAARRDVSRAGMVPSTPAAANSQYSRTAHDREAVLAQRSRKKRTKRKRILLVTLGVVLVLALGGMGAAWAYINQVDNTLRDDLDEDLLGSLSVTDSPSDPFYMLLIGIDKSEARESSGTFGGSFRTDSMMLARIDPQDKEVTLISIPRDTKIELVNDKTGQNYGTQKINAAYAFGGASLAVDTVSKLAGVPISHYAEIDFDGFKAVIDALGGVDVNVPIEIDDSKAGGHLDAGEQTLNGEQALILCRSRHTYDDLTDGDAMRAANQRLVLSAIMDKIMSSDVATLTNTVNTLAQYITTDYSVAGIVGLAQSMVGIDVSSNVYTAAVPTTSSYENNIWYEVLNETEWEQMMERVKEGLPPTEEDQVDEATGITISSTGSGGSGSSGSSSSSSGSASLSNVKVSVKNGCGIAGCADQAAQKLTPEGAVVETGNADDFNYSSTIVIYDDASDADTAQHIVDLLGKGTAKKNDGTYGFSGDVLVVIGSDWQ